MGYTYSEVEGEGERGETEEGGAVFPWRRIHEGSEWLALDVGAVAC